MGANAQTSVPFFVANTVLTASAQNLSAGTGVPVFATTVTRDAAFGGANKALAKGQLCYLEATNIVQYYDGTAWATVGPSTQVVKQVLSSTLTTAFTSGAAGAYANVTGLSVVITPATATNKILIMATVNGGTFMAIKVTGGNTATGYSVNSYASADAAGNNDYVATASMLYLDSPATTSAVTYQVQSKDLAGGTSYINRSQNSATAVAASTITCMEIVA
jgi:hypothetical protein